MDVVKLKILIPFWDLNLFDRYERQFKNLASENEVSILYRYGEIEKKWECFFNFIELEFQDFGHRYATWYFNKDICPSFVPSDLDLVYSLSGLWMNIYGNKIAEFYNIPHVIRMRGDISEARKFQGIGKVQRFLFNRAFEDAIRNCTLIVPIVDKFKYTLKGLGINETKIFETVPNGIDVEEFEPHFPLKFTPGYAGRISTEKGSEFLLKLIEETKEYTWKITGKIQDRNFIPPNNCHYLGKTPRNQMANFYNEVSLLVQPSYSEGFPNIILEIYANNKPVLASYQAMPEEIKIFGQVLNHELGLWIEALHEIEGLYNHYRHGAREYVKKFSWENNRVKLMDAFNRAKYLYDTK